MIKIARCHSAEIAAAGGDGCCGGESPAAVAKQNSHGAASPVIHRYVEFAVAVKVSDDYVSGELPPELKVEAVKPPLPSP